MIGRRQFVTGSCACALVATPLLAGLAGCGSARKAGGPQPISWDRDACTQCRMILSDRRFAVQLQGGPRDEHWVFDDIGCALTWLRAQPWRASAPAQIWVAALDSRGDQVHWLDARRAHFVAGRSSPMGYNFGALAAPEPGSVGFDALEALLPDRGTMGMSP